MKPNRVAQAVAVILAIFGVAALLAAGMIATRQYTVAAGGRHFRCGSVLAPKDPRNRVSNRVQLPRAYQTAYRRCTNDGQRPHRDRRRSS